MLLSVKIISLWKTHGYGIHGTGKVSKVKHESSEIITTHVRDITYPLSLTFSSTSLIFCLKKTDLSIISFKISANVIVQKCKKFLNLNQKR
jgi:hypothetical protein